MGTRRMQEVAPGRGQVGTERGQPIIHCLEVETDFSKNYSKPQTTSLDREGLDPHSECYLCVIHTI